jgi:hypothetical protein
MCGEVVAHVCVTHHLINIKSHVRGFGALLLDCIVDDTICCGVVCLEVCCLLWMAHFCEFAAVDSARLGVNKNKAKLDLGDEGDYMFNSELALRPALLLSPFTNENLFPFSN